MTEEENKTITDIRIMVAEIKNDLRWLNKSFFDYKTKTEECHEKQEEHFRQLNGSVKTNTIFRKIATYMGTVLFFVVVGTLIKMACFGV